MEATCDRNWAELPKELLEQILSHLYGEDMRSFHLVCRHWHAAEEFVFQKEHNPLVFPVPQSQWLLHEQCPYMNYQFIHPVYPNVRYTKDLHEEAEKFNDEGAIVRHSKDGWLLMSSGNRSMFFICPFPGIVIELPDLIIQDELDGVTFTCAPTSTTDSCVVFVISCFERKDVNIATIRLGKKKWKVNKYENNILFRPSYSNPVFLKEMFYCLSHEGNLGVYNHKEDSWTVLEKPPRPPPRKWAYENHLVEHDGGLMSVFIGDSWVSVFKLKESDSDMVWENVHSLGDYALFVSVSTSFATKSVLDMMKNKIFFPLLHNNYPVFYCLETKTFRTYGSDLCENNFYRSELEGQLESGWIEPAEYETNMDYEFDEGTKDETSEDEEYETNDESGSEEEEEVETNNDEKYATNDESGSEEEEKDETTNDEKIVEIIDMACRRKGASSRPPNAQSCPWLMFSHGKSRNIQTFYSIADGRCLNRMLPYLSQNTTIRANCDNWAVITTKKLKDGGSLSCFLLHLISLDKILLSNLEDIEYESCFLSSSPLKPNCIVAFISWMNVDDYDKEETWRSRIKFWRPNQESWVEVVTEVGLSEFVTCDGAIYGIQCFPGSYIVTVDILDNDIQVKQQFDMPRPMWVGSIRSDTVLIESCGDIFLIEQCMLGIAGKRIRTVQVYKLMKDKKTIKMDWIRVNDIGDRVFFIHHSLPRFYCSATQPGLKGNFSCSATHTGLKRNSIYFTGFKQDNHIYRYNILENRICETLPCPHVVHNIRQNCWLMIHQP